MSRRKKNQILQNCILFPVKKASFKQRDMTTLLLPVTATQEITSSGLPKTVYLKPNSITLDLIASPITKLLASRFKYTNQSHTKQSNNIYIYNPLQTDLKRRSKEKEP